MFIFFFVKMVAITLATLRTLNVGLNGTRRVKELDIRGCMKLIR